MAGTKTLNVGSRLGRFGKLHAAALAAAPRRPPRRRLRSCPTQLTAMPTDYGAPDSTTIRPMLPRPASIPHRHPEQSTANTRQRRSPAACRPSSKSPGDNLSRRPADRRSGDARRRSPPGRSAAAFRDPAFPAQGGDGRRPLRRPRLAAGQAQRLPRLVRRLRRPRPRRLRDLHPRPRPAALVHRQPLRTRLRRRSQPLRSALSRPLPGHAPVRERRGGRGRDELVRPRRAPANVLTLPGTAPSTPSWRLSAPSGPAASTCSTPASPSGRPT